MPALSAPPACRASNSAGAASAATAMMKLRSSSRTQRGPCSPPPVCFMGASGTARPAAASTVAALAPLTPSRTVSALASASFTLLRSTYMENFFRKAGRMSADSTSAWPSASGQIRKLAIMRPLGELKLFHAAASGASLFTSLETRLWMKAAESGPTERIVPRCSSGTTTVEVVAAEASEEGSVKCRLACDESSLKRAPCRARWSVQAVMVSVCDRVGWVRGVDELAGYRLSELSAMQYYRRPPNGGRPCAHHGLVDPP